MPKDTTVTLRMSNDLKRALQELAVEDRRTLSSYIEIVLEKHAHEQLTRHGQYAETLNVYKGQNLRHSKKRGSA